MLKTVLKKLVSANGFDCLEEERFINVLSDCRAFDDCAAAKYVLKTVIDRGFARRLYANVEAGMYSEDVAIRIVDELFSKYGFRKDVAEYVINGLLQALNQEELSVIFSDNTIASSVSNDDSHIKFSGISLGHSIKEIASYMLTRGFKEERVMPYEIKMTGTYCGNDNCVLYIYGSPLGVTKCVKVYCETGIMFEPCNKLYNLLENKYGLPYSIEDPLQSLKNDFNYYLKNICKYSRMQDDYSTVVDCKWNVEGGNIDLHWFGRGIWLTYTDEVNSAMAEQHQEQFNVESI